LSESLFFVFLATLPPPPGITPRSSCYAFRPFPKYMFPNQGIPHPQGATRRIIPFFFFFLKTFSPGGPPFFSPETFHPFRFSFFSLVPQPLPLSGCFSQTTRRPFLAWLARFFLGLSNEPRALSSPRIGPQRLPTVPHLAGDPYFTPGESVNPLGTPIFLPFFFLCLLKKHSSPLTFSPFLFTNGAPPAFDPG